MRDIQHVLYDLHTLQSLLDSWLGHRVFLGGGTLMLRVWGHALSHKMLSKLA